MQFSELAIYLDKLEKTSSRLAITEILADLFKKSDSSEIDKICYLVLGQLAPGYKGIVFNVAEKMMIRVLAKAYGATDEKALKVYKEKGDIGDAAHSLSHVAQKNGKNLSIIDVHNRLFEIAKDAGEESVERKVDGISALLLDVDPISAKFLARIPVGRLRLGFSDKTILDALSWMETGGKSGKVKLEEAYNILPDVGILARDVKEHGIDKASKNVTPVLGVPILPMLCSRIKSPKEMIEKMSRVMVEPKYDGLRIQIHYTKFGFKLMPIEIERGQDNKVKAFTRNLNENSWMFPELSEIGKYIKADEVILDSEAVGVDSIRKTMSNFQTTMSRRRKHDIEELAKKVSITFKVFDIMYKDGEGLAHLPYEERRKILSKTIDSGELLEEVEYEITEKPEVINAWMEKELKGGLEGIIVKKSDSRYIAGRTGYRWVKMKEKEGQKAKLADTVDLVIMGFTAGKGKRVSFGMGQFLGGIRDGESIKSVTKIGTGLSDKQFKELKKRLNDLVTKERPKEYEVPKTLIPDFWVNPEVVVEIAADEITKSPNHASGYALRFPRLVKFRDDKNTDQATTIKEIEKLYKLQ